MSSWSYRVRRAEGATQWDAVLFLTITDPQTPDEAEGFFSVT